MPSFKVREYDTHIDSERKSDGDVEKCEKIMKEEYGEREGERERVESTALRERYRERSDGGGGTDMCME